MRVFLTGGTGLLGSHVAERLRSIGAGVVALHRPGADIRHLRALGCDLVVGGLTDAIESQTARMVGCQGLVHAAAEVYGGGSLDLVRTTNVDGTRSIFGAAVEAGLTHGVHVSSVAVYGNAPGRMSEETPLRSELTPDDFYAITKREAELAAEAFHGMGELGLTILRPPLIYGERDRRFTVRVAGALRGRRIYLPGSGRNRFAAVYAGNVVDAIERALKGAGSGEVFNVTEDVTITLRGFYEGLGRELGIRPYFVNIPAWLVRRGVRMGTRRGWQIPGAPGLSLTRAARLAMEDNPYPAGKARQLLGWSPPYSLEEALERTGRWLRGLREREVLNGQ